MQPIQERKIRPESRVRVSIVAVVPDSSELRCMLDSVCILLQRNQNNLKLGDNKSNALLALEEII